MAMDTSRTIQITEHSTRRTSNDESTDTTDGRPPNSGRPVLVAGAAALAATCIVAISAGGSPDRPAAVDKDTSATQVVAASSILLDGGRFQLAVGRAVADLPPPVTTPSALLDGESFARAVDAALETALGPAQP